MAERRDSPVIYVSVRTPKATKGERVEEYTTDRITQLTYEDDEKKADKLTLTIDNHDLAFIDSPVWRKGSILTASWGYVGRLAPPRECVIDKVTGGPKMKVEAHDRGLVMHKRQRNRIWPDATRSEVVRAIAEQYGFDETSQWIQRTDERYEQITQARMTDLAFLRDLAKREGFQFWVDYDGMHFHQRQLDQRPLRSFVWFSDPRQGDMLSFSIDNDISAGKPGRIRVRGFDPLTHEEIDELADNDTLTDRTTLAEVLDIVAHDDGDAAGEPLVADVGGEWYIPTTERNAEAAKRYAVGRYLETQLTAVKLSFKAVGDPWLVSKSTILVERIGPTVSGLYYVGTVKHSVSSSEFSIDVKAKSDGKAMATNTAYDSLQHVPGQGTGVRSKGKKNDGKTQGDPSNTPPDEQYPNELQNITDPNEFRQRFYGPRPFNRPAEPTAAKAFDVQDAVAELTGTGIYATQT